MKKCHMFLIGLTVFAPLLWAADGAWLQHVPESDRKRVNPLAGQRDAIAAGERMFQDHCAKCHGPDVLGRGKRPSLRSDRVQQATDGEIFWILKNGNLAKGMPTWAALPEPLRWQIIAYVKSLGPASSAANTTQRVGLQTAVNP